MPFSVDPVAGQKTQETKPTAVKTSEKALANIPTPPGALSFYKPGSGKQNIKTTLDVVLGKIPNLALFEPARGAVAEAEAEIRGVSEAIKQKSFGAGVQEYKKFRPVSPINPDKQEEFGTVAPVLGRGITGFQKGVTFGYSEPALPQSPNTGVAGDIAEGAGHAFGFTASLLATGAALKGVSVYGRAVDALSKGSKLSKFTAPVLQNVASMVARGQLDKNQLESDFKERMGQAVSDAKMGVLFSGIDKALGVSGSSISKLPVSELAKKSMNVMIEYPTMFGVGYAMTEGSFKEKVANGITFALLHRMMKMRDEPSVPLTAKEQQAVQNAIKQTRATWMDTLTQRRATLKSVDLQKPNFDIATSDQATEYGKTVMRDLGKKGEVRFELANVEEPLESVDGKTVFLPKKLGGPELKEAIVDHFMENKPTTDLVPEKTFSEEQRQSTEKVGRLLLKEGGMTETPKPEAMFPGRSIIEPTGQMAKKMEDNHGIPLYNRFYLPIKEAEIQTRNLEEASTNIVRNTLGEDMASDPAILHKAGLYGNRLQIEKVPRNSPKAAEIAAELGLTPEQKSAYDKMMATLYPAFKQVADLTGVPIGTKEEYGPLIRRDLPPTEAVASPEAPSSNLKFFAQHVRGEGKVRNAEDYHTNPFVVARIYARLLGRGAFMQDAIDNYKAMRPHLPKDARERFDDFVEANTGRTKENSPIDRFMDNTATFLDNKFGGDARAAGRMARDIIGTTFHSNMLGLPKLHVPLLQELQLYQFGPAEFGIKNFVKNVKGVEVDALKKENWEKGRKKGWHNVGMPGEAEVKAANFQEAGGAKKAALTAQNIISKTTALIPFLDAHSRVKAGLMGERVWDANVGKLKESEGGIDAFFKETGIDRMPKSEQNAIRESIESGNMEEARDRHSLFRSEGINFSLTPGEFATGRRTGIFTGPARMYTSFPLQTLDTVLNRYSLPQKATFLGTALGLMMALKKIGLDETKQIGPSSALSGISNLAQVALSTASALFGGLKTLDPNNPQREQDRYAAEKEFASAIKNFMPGSSAKKQFDRFAKSQKHDWMLYNNYLQPITQGTPMLATAQLLGLPLEKVSEAYDVRDLSDKQIVERMKKVDQLKSLILQDKFDEALQYVRQNPEVSNYNPSDLFEPVEIKAIKAVPKSGWSQFVKDYQKLKKP